MFANLLNILLNTLQSIIHIVLYPIDLLLGSLFPSYTSLVNYFTNILAFYVNPCIGYFISLLPTRCKAMFVLYLTFMITLGGALLTYHSVLYVWKLIQKVKFW